ncbi:MAG: DUF1501 domain-containing protein, partial [bacterium]|nr:DUF1501 domain-containing protein [bacterium]
MSEHPSHNIVDALGRRAFLGRSSAMGLGAIALQMLGGRASSASEQSVREALPHFAPKAKRVIFLTQSGGPSQIELYDYKPGLAKVAGTPLPES